MEYKNEELDGIIESIVFIAGSGLLVSEIVRLLEVPPNDIKASITRLTAKYSGTSGIHLISYNGKIQFSSNSNYAAPVATVLNPIKEKELSKAALETIAIIAYKQPVTRLEIEQIRGVSSDYAVQLLLSHQLIEVVGRKDVVGKPLLFGTTDEFLKRFQIESIDGLPDYEVLLENIKVIGGERQTTLYNEYELAEETTPEFLQGEDVEKF